MRIIPSASFLLLFSLVFWPSSLRAETVVVADAQLVSMPESEYLLLIRSSGPQAFDIIPEQQPDSHTLHVRLYQATLGEIPALETGSLGSIVLTQENEKDVMLKINLSETGYQTSVQQGASPDIVAIRIARATDQTAPGISGIQVVDLTSSSAKIVWDTDEPADAQVFYGVTQPETQTSALDSEQTLHHEILLTGLEPGTQYSFKVRSRDASENFSESASALFTTSAPAFQESGGVVVMEAEHFDKNISRSGKSWTLKTDNDKKYVGSGFMSVGPNSGVVFDSSFTETSPELVYSVNFSKTGTYYVWLRGRGASTYDDSVHAGLNGVALTSADRISSFMPWWIWQRATMDGSIASIQVTKVGVQTFHLWMREDGFEVDRIFLTTSNAYNAPIGSGPSESPRSE